MHRGSEVRMPGQRVLKISLEIQLLPSCQFVTVNIIFQLEGNFVWGFVPSQTYPNFRVKT